MRMKTFTKTVALFVVMALMMVMTISAATVTDVDVSYDYSTGSVEITAMHPDGADGFGKIVTIVVTDGNTDIYWNDAVVDEFGQVNFTFIMDPETTSGTYGVDIGGAGLEINSRSDEDTNDTFAFVNAEDAMTFMEGVNLNISDDPDTLKNFLETDNGGIHQDVDCREFLDDGVTNTDYWKTGAGRAIADVLDNETYTENQAGYYRFLEKFKQAVVILLMRNGTASNVVEKYGEVFGFETESEEEFDEESAAGKYALLSSAQRDVVEAALLNGTFEPDEGAEVLATFNEVTALALYNDLRQLTKGNLFNYIKYTNNKGYTDIDTEDYEDLASDTYRDMVQDDMADATFRTFDDVAYVFENAVEDAEKAYKKSQDKTTPSSDGPSTSIVVTPVLPVVPVDMFDDIAGVEWAKTAINELAKQGVINGVADKTFAPNDVLTREQFVKILVGALDIKASGNTPFTDVVASEWYANYVAIAYNSGIANGTDETTFGVGQSLTREQLCTMVYRAIKALGIELDMVNSSSAFADSAEISDWAKEAVDYLYRAGVVNGVGGNKFDPQGTTTRAMGAKVIYGVLEGGAK